MGNIIETVLLDDLCCGCGLCVAICPEGRLSMTADGRGEIKPIREEKCSNDCSMCYKVCPFAEGNPNEDEIGDNLFGLIPNIKHDSVTGYYLSSYVGHVASELRREQSASGGVATWLLTTLFSNRIIDYAICVSPSSDPDFLFKYSLMRDTIKIESSSGSAYYPTQLCDIISYILKTPGRYAITALPCFAKGIRLAQMKNRLLKERIVCIIGITCDQMKSKMYTEYLAEISGVKGKLSKVNYRGKTRDQPTNNYFFSCENSSNALGGRYWHEGVSEAWSSRWFTLNSCNYCDDIFAECADAVCMDAWLPEYISDWRGTSLVVVRSQQLLEMLKSGIEDCEIVASEIPLSKIKQSQSGLIAFKRHDLRVRLWLAEKDGLRIQTKRVSAKRNLNQIGVMKAQLLMNIQNNSKLRLSECRYKGGLDYIRFSESMRSNQKKLLLLQRVGMIINIPSFVKSKLEKGRKTN